ncbi:MAG: LPS export ABC transporter periplasmic protein LptC [Alkalilacustris sp.]
MSYSIGLARSRTVASLKLALPLLSLALLSTLFLLARDIDPSRAVPSADVDADDLARDPRIVTSRLSSVTVDGTEIEMTAATVRVAAGGRETTEAEDITLVLTAPDGGISRVRADHAVIDQLADLMTLTGSVHMLDVTGHTLSSAQMLIAMDRSRAHSPGPVEADGPLGRIEAGAMTLTSMAAPEAPTAEVAAAPYLLSFTGGVRLLHQPDSGE